MKAQHQIRFKKRRKIGKQKDRSSKLLDAKFVKNPSDTADVVRATVLVDERQLKLARALSDTEKKVRDSSLLSLREWLTQNSDQVGEQELDKLWKGLFYCIWMADKRPIITETINNVVNLADILGWPFLDTLHTCLMREWFGIDRHRVDKFYELANVGIEKCVSMVVAAENLVSAAQVYMHLLQKRVWNAVRQRGMGLALHLLDVYVDKVMYPIMAKGEELSDEQKEELLGVLIKGPLSMVGSANGNLLAIGKRTQEQILGKLLDFLRSEIIRMDKASQWRIAKSISDHVFNIAAKKETPEEVRKALYDIHIDMKAFADEAKEG